MPWFFSFTANLIHHQVDLVTALSERRSPPNWGEAGVRDCNSPTATLPLADEAFCGRSSKWNLLFSLLFDLPEVNITNNSSFLTSKLSPKSGTRIRDGWSHKNGWLFIKVSNGLWPPPLIFGKVAMTRKPQHLTIYNMYGMVTFLALTRPNQPIWCMATQEISSKYEYQMVITDCSGQTFGGFWKKQNI